eukprot:g17592.t1
MGENSCQKSWGGGQGQGYTTQGPPETALASRLHVDPDVLAAATITSRSTTLQLLQLAGHVDVQRSAGPRWAPLAGANPAKHFATRLLVLGPVSLLARAAAVVHNQAAAADPHGPGRRGRGPGAALSSPAGWTDEPGEAAEAPTRVQDLEEQSARCTTAAASSVVWDQVRQEVIGEAEARLEAFLRRGGPIEGLDWTVLQQEVLAALRGPAGGQRGLSRGGGESGEPPAKRRKTEVANAGGAEPAAASPGVPSQPPGGQAGSAA